MMHDAQLYVDSQPAGDTNMPEFVDSPAQIGMCELAPSLEVTITTTCTENLDAVCVCKTLWPCGY